MKKTPSYSYVAVLLWMTVALSSTRPVSSVRGRARARQRNRQSNVNVNVNANTPIVDPNKRRSYRRLVKDAFRKECPEQVATLSRRNRFRVDAVNARLCEDGINSVIDVTIKKRRGDKREIGMVQIGCNGKAEEVVCGPSCETTADCPDAQFCHITKIAGYSICGSYVQVQVECAGVTAVGDIPKMCNPDLDFCDFNRYAEIAEASQEAEPVVNSEGGSLRRKMLDTANQVTNQDESVSAILEISVQPVAADAPGMCRQICDEDQGPACPAGMWCRSTGDFFYNPATQQVADTEEALYNDEAFYIDEADRPPVPPIFPTPSICVAYAGLGASCGFYTTIDQQEICDPKTAKCINDDIMIDDSGGKCRPKCTPPSQRSAAVEDPFPSCPNGELCGEDGVCWATCRSDDECTVYTGDVTSSITERDTNYWCKPGEAGAIGVCTGVVGLGESCSTNTAATIGNRCSDILTCFVEAENATTGICQ